MSTPLSRRQMLKRTGLIGAGLALGPGALAACDSSATTPGTTSGAASSNGGGSAGSVASSAMPSPTGAKPASLTGLWVPYDALQNASKAVAASWTKTSGIPVTINTVPWADWDRTVRAFPQQPTPPDIAIVDGPALEGYAANGILFPLDNYFPAADLADFLPGTTPAAKWKGQFYGPATNESSQALVYNADLLKKHGVTPPTELDKAWTWPELRKIMIDIQTAERKSRGDNQFWGIFVGQGNFIGGATYTGLDLIRSKGANGIPLKSWRVFMPLPVGQR